jgi:hypothetical protein
MLIRLGENLLMLLSDARFRGGVMLGGNIKTYDA